MYFTIERIKRILAELKTHIYPFAEPVTGYKIKQGNFTGGENADTWNWKDFRPGERWGGKEEENRHFWFRTEIAIPREYAGKEVVYHVKTGTEGDWDLANPQLLIYVNNEIVQGLDIRHRETILCKNANPGEIFSIALFSYCGIRGGLVELESTISLFDREAEKLYYHIKVPLEVAELMEVQDKKRIRVLDYLNKAVNIIDFRKPYSDDFKHSIEKAIGYLENDFYSQYCGNEELSALCVGHTHIDVAWLWTLAQTREKVARSFSTVLSLMKEYPEYIFMSSQPQLYQFLKEDHPDIYCRIKERVEEGRWEPEGAMWLEADCNLTSGESLVRQILFGTRFFKEEFGIKNEILWLPDVFGYSAALPQILKKSGIKYFMTTKLGWNEYNGIPYDTFNWRGIDGTEILTHFITTQDPKFNITPHATSYNGFIEPAQVVGAWKRYQQKDLNEEVLIAFGYGDGGGGPTREMLENARRLDKGIPGCPKVKIGKAIDFFHKLEETVKLSTRLPKWAGELYLEYHRGTYTSMARNKKYNRKSEFLYQDVELFSTMAKGLLKKELYQQEKINNGWRTILLNQFHDIIPGSGIKEVYEDSRRDYEKVLKAGNQMLMSSLKSLADNIDLKNDALLVFNQLCFERSDIISVCLPESSTGLEVIDEQGALLPTQIIKSAQDEASEDKLLIFYAGGVPSKGYKCYSVRNSDIAVQNISSEDLKISIKQIENKFFRIELDENANFASIFDKQNRREVLKKGEKGNVFQAFEDKPHNYDAWDINIYYQEKMWEINTAESVEVIETGPVRACLRVKRVFVDSILIQDIILYRDIPRIDFINKIDWKESQVLLKVAFPMDIQTDKASYEIQYGNVERPTHKNTSWDFARFEVCAHKWVDLSEDGYGVSLMNDCKYGHDIHDGVMRLTLIKSAIEPNEDADREIHQFKYSLYPHKNNWKSAGTVSTAYSLNCPMYSILEAKHAGSLPSKLSFVKSDCDNVVIEVVKKAEDSDDTIVRLYECFGRRGNVTLTFYSVLVSAFECDLLENNIEAMDHIENHMSFEIKPYEIKTFKIKLLF